VLHAKALPGNPYDGHTLRDVIGQTQKLTGREIERIRPLKAALRIEAQY
jgi:IS5 family transposase